jgi:adenine-specific DNA-methyltransferase
MNILIKGDNEVALRTLVERGYAESIDLIYVDPPFATGGDFVITEGRASTVSQSRKGVVAYQDRIKGKSFVESIRKRMMIARRLMSPQGSIYLHTDYKIGHYLKVMMDEVFGIENFRNDITRIKCNPKNFKRIAYGNEKDMILFYTKGKLPIWNEPSMPYTDADLKKLYPKVDKDGRHYTTVPIHAPGETLKPQAFKGMFPPEGRHWRTDVKTMEQWDEEGLIEWSANGNPRKKVFPEDSTGKRMQDVWTFKDPQYPTYPTEKNLEMLEMIVRTSSSEQSTVMDFYCGGGTTLKAASMNGRNWIGIDNSDLAIEATRERLGLKEEDLGNSWEYWDLRADKKKVPSERE